MTTWLDPVTRRRALNHLRQRRPTPVDTHELVGAGRDVGAATVGIEDEALDRLSLDELLAAVDRLPTHHREVLVLCFVDDLPYGEVAEILSIPSGTVKSRVSTARATLIKKLQPERTDARVDVSNTARRTP